MNSSTPSLHPRHWNGWLAAVGLLLVPTVVRAGLADMRISEILYDPVGVNNGAQWIELMNAGSEPVVLNGAWIGADNSARPLAVTGLDPVPPGGLVLVHWNAKGTSGGRDFFTGTVTNLRASHGSLNLTGGSNPLDVAAMLAFAQWGAADQKGAAGASGRGLWPRDQFLPKIAAGHSQSLAPGGSPRLPAGWYDAANPTPGAVNTAPVSAWRGWRLVGTAALTPAATWEMADDLLDVVSVAANGAPIHYRHHNDLWAPGVTLAPLTSLPVALAGSGGGTLDLALTDPDGGVWQRRLRAGGWSAPVLLGRAALLPPALAYNPAAKELELVVADPAGALQFSRSAGSAWTPWGPVGALVGPVAPTLAINILDRPFDLLFTAPDGMVTGAHFAAGAWSPPLPAGGQTTLRPAVAVTGAGTVEVVVTGPDHKVYHNQLTDGFWAGWRWTGLESAVAPTLLSSPAENGLELFATGLDGRLLHQRMLNGAWGTPWPLGGVTGQPTAVTAGPDGGLELLLAGADGSLWHNRFRPSAPDLVSLTHQVQKIFDAHCVQCHESGDPIAGEDLEPDAAYFSLVHAPSSEVPSLRRVDPGKPEKSYLINKVTGTQKSVGGKGERMPLGGQLSDDEIRTLRDWITQGALNN